MSKRILTNDEIWERKRTERQAQRKISSIGITVAWSRNGNPLLEAIATFADNALPTTETFKTRCSGSGYDKLSTVMSDVFEHFLGYKLEESERFTAPEAVPYGISKYADDRRHYAGGVGINCYTRIATFIGGELTRIGGTSSVDVYTYREGKE